jgi:uncharacterized membrane protein
MPDRPVVVVYLVAFAALAVGVFIAAYGIGENQVAPAGVGGLLIVAALYTAYTAELDRRGR